MTDIEQAPPAPIRRTSTRPKAPTRPPPPAPLEIPEQTQRADNQETEAEGPSTAKTQITESPLDNLEDKQKELTSLRAHYLKKSLITLEFHQELDVILGAPATPNVSALSYLGTPFALPPKGAPNIDLPFLKYAFRQFVLSFPFLAGAPKNFFPEKLQPFIASLQARNISSSSVFDDEADVEDQHTRQKLMARAEKQLALLMSAATRLVEQESVVRLSQADLDRLENLARRRIKQRGRKQDLFEVNVVCVRTVTSKGRLRSRVHEEFIIRTRRSNQRDVFVSRRYGDFKTLADELRKMHPNELIRSPPNKDRSVVTASISAGLTTPTSPVSILSQQSAGGNDSSDSLGGSPPPQGNASYRLAREKNRLTLRSYLHSLMTSPVIASSPVLKSFLLSDPTKLSPNELEDARRREEADAKRDEGRKHFATQIAQRVENLRSAMKIVKEEVMAKSGLSRLLAVIRETEDARRLPKEYQAVIEWGRISLASTLFQHFVAADDASENMAGLKRIHGLMPYFVLKGILKISNPVSMIRSMLDLFLAQPFGGRSLLQRMFTSSLQDEVKALEEHIEAVRQKVNDDMLCAKIQQFVNAPQEIQNFFKSEAANENINILTAILRSQEEPQLSREQMQRVIRAHHAHAAYMKHKSNGSDSDDDDGPQDEDAWLYEDLTIYAKLCSKLRDREQLIALIFEGTTADLLKDIITIFYSPLAEVYKAANIAESLGDVQNFINDLIKTVEQSADASQGNPQVIVNSFIELVQRHEQSFYNFVHKVHSKGAGLFDSFAKWIELFINISREGLGEPISLEFMLPHTGPERLEIMKEIDDVATYHYKLKLAHEEKVRRRFANPQAQTEADAEDEAAQLMINGLVRDLSFGELVKGDAEDMNAEEDSSEEGETDSSDEGSDEETDSEEDSEEEEEEVATLPPKKPPMSRQPPSRSATMTAPRRPLNGIDNPSRGTSSLDLHRSRSQTASHPPTPLSKSASFDYPRSSPASPAQGRPPNTAPSRPGAMTFRARPQSKGDGKHKQEIIKPPELVHIPKLLPLFVEMMRPSLRPQPLQ